MIQLLGDKLPIEDRLYSTVKELEEMVEKISKQNKDDKKYSSEKDERQNGFLYKSAQIAKNWNNGIGDFAKNYTDMIDANTDGADKYFHAKANCEASQRGKLNENIAKKMSDTRENVELITNRYKKKKDGTNMTSEEIKKDYKADQSANSYGRLQGAKNKNLNCKVLVDKYRPNGLDKKY